MRRAPCRPACLRPRRTLLSDDSRLARCGADSSAVWRRRGSGGQRRRVLSPRPGQAGEVRATLAAPAPRREGRASLAGLWAQVSRLSPCGPGLRPVPGPCGEAAEGWPAWGLGRLARRVRWAGAPSPAVLIPFAAARGHEPQDRVAAGPPSEA